MKRIPLDTAKCKQSLGLTHFMKHALLFWTDKDSLYFDNNGVFRIGMIFSMLYFQRKVMSSGHTTLNLE